MENAALVWVDACHDYEYVCRDTESALRIVAPGGWILWHDYRHTAWWSGVTRCLQQLKRKHQALFHVKGTTIAALQVGENVATASRTSLGECSLE